MKGKRIAGIVLMIIGVLVVATSLSGGSKEPVITGSIAVALGLLLLLLSFRKKQEKQQNINWRKVNGVLLSGLPVAEGTEGEVLFDIEQLSLRFGGLEYKLPYTRIYDVSVKTEIEVQKQYVSSTGGAVAGAVLFGALGAIVGGRVKEKSHKTEKEYLLVTYEKEGEQAGIALELKNSYAANVKTMIDQVRAQFGKANAVVEL